MRLSANLCVVIVSAAALALVGCSGSDEIFNPSPPVDDGGGDDVADPPDPEPDPPCSGEPGNTDRFVDCGNGTVTDTQTGLVWLKDAGCLFAPWHLAYSGLGDGVCGLTDNSTTADWRLPTLECAEGETCDLADAIGELASIFAPNCPPPFIPDTSGSGCWSEGNPFTGVQSAGYWSTTPFGNVANHKWHAFLGDEGHVDGYHQGYSQYGWPVRR